VLAVALGALAFAVQTGTSALGPVGLALGAWVVFGAGRDLWAKTGQQGSVARLFRLPRAEWGKAIAHTGFGVLVFACAAMNAWVVEDIRVVQEGDRFPLGRYEVELRSVEEVRGPNFDSTMAEMVVWRGDQPVVALYPEKRYYPVASMPTTEAAIDYGLFRDIYLTVGDPQDGGGWAVRSYIKPFANWLWIGSALLALGAAVSLSDRRWRLAAGARAGRQVAAVPAE
jgi:cytochrome c-type biogenesis protein CcmF